MRDGRRHGASRARRPVAAALTALALGMAAGCAAPTTTTAGGASTSGPGRSPTTRAAQSGGAVPTTVAGGGGGDPSASSTEVTPTEPTTAAPPGAEPTGPARPADAEGPYPVVQVVDGDTVKVDRRGTKVTLRLIGLDTPETKDPRKPVQCFGREASAHATQLLAGQSVWLTTDPTQGTVDKYGRTLAYLWLPDGRLYDWLMVWEGYAHEYTYDLPYRYQDDIKAAERSARQAERGLWSPTTCAGDTTKPAS